MRTKERRPEIKINWEPVPGKPGWVKPSKKLKKHKGGATSSDMGGVRYDLLPVAGLTAGARRAGYGAVRHGEWNWRKSQSEQFAKERKNHMAQHVALFMEFNRQEDLDAIIFNGMMLADMKARGLLKEAKESKTNK